MKQTKALQFFAAPFLNCGDNMSIMVKKLYESGASLYQMRFLAGKSGLENPVQWVHIIEDENVTSFLHGGELVFTAGILNNRPDWLLNFARQLYEIGASAFVVNIGPYTAEVPQDVINYCNEVSMPLFSIPWETRMVDMTCDFCHRIIKSEQMDLNIVTTLKNIIFKIGDLDTQILQMERYGYPRESKLCFISLNIDGNRPEVYEVSKKLRTLAERTAKQIHERFISFSYNECRIMVLVDYTDREIEMFVGEFLRRVNGMVPGAGIRMGISPNQLGLYDQYKNMEKAICSMEMAEKRGEAAMFFDKLGHIYKLLFAVEDTEVLKGIYADVIGKLEKYDQDNDTNLTQMLKVYLENNGSLQAVAAKQYVHRNTVINQLKRIEKVTGYDPLSLPDKVLFYMGINIKDVL